MKIYVGVNEDHSVSFHAEEPKRIKHNEKGMWWSKYPFVSSIICKNIESVILQSNMSWTDEVEIFEIDPELILQQMELANKT